MAEDKQSRLDRELAELLEELRVVLPGVQVLFAFLLTVPFTQRFDKIAGDVRSVYFVAFMAATFSSISLITPSAYHRIRWRDYDKERLLRTSTKLALAGITLLSVAISCVVWVITTVVFSNIAAAFSTAAAAGAALWLWFGLGLSRKIRDQKGNGPPKGPRRR